MQVVLSVNTTNAEKFSYCPVMVLFVVKRDEHFDRYVERFCLLHYAYDSHSIDSSYKWILR